jgi:hypothetical protein
MEAAMGLVVDNDIKIVKLLKLDACNSKEKIIVMKAKM